MNNANVVIGSRGVRIAHTHEHYHIFKEYWPRWNMLHFVNGSPISISELVDKEGMIMSLHFNWILSPFQRIVGVRSIETWQEFADDLLARARAIADKFNSKERMETIHDIDVHLARMIAYEDSEGHKLANLKFVTPDGVVMEFVAWKYNELKKLARFINDYADCIREERT